MTRLLEETQPRPPGSYMEIEAFHQFNAGPAGYRVNATTFHAAIDGFANADVLRGLRKQSSLRQPPRVIGAGLRMHTRPYYEPRVKQYAMPFLFADAAVVRLTRSLATTYITPTVTPPLQFAVYLNLGPRGWRTTWNLAKLYLGSSFFLPRRTVSPWSVVDATLVPLGHHGTIPPGRSDGGYDSPSHILDGIFCTAAR